MSWFKNSFSWISAIIWVFLFSLAALPLFRQLEQKPISIRSTTRTAVVGQTISDSERVEVAKRVNTLWQQLITLHVSPHEYLPGASEEQILEVEDQIGVPLPADYRAFLKLCNGSISSSSSLYPRVLGTEYLMVKEPLTTYAEFTSPLEYSVPSKKFKTSVEVSNQAHPAFLVIADSDGAGPVLNLASGEIYWWDHDGWSFSYYCDSFERMLELAVKATQEKKSPTWGFYR